MKKKLSYADKAFQNFKNEKYSRKKKVEVGEVTYDSITEASLKLKISRAVLSKRIKSKKEINGLKIRFV